MEVMGPMNNMEVMGPMDNMEVMGPMDNMEVMGPMDKVMEVMGPLDQLNIMDTVVCCNEAWGKVLHTGDTTDSPQDVTGDEFFNQNDDFIGNELYDTTAQPTADGQVTETIIADSWEDIYGYTQNYDIGADKQYDGDDSPTDETEPVN
ncbi:hypothetical protein cypCar_00003582 [Cyprinus carpio]|nr:hypothetical protein cypCar_00003582 [Cyprinus carpio]